MLYTFLSIASYFNTSPLVNLPLPAPSLFRSLLPQFQFSFKLVIHSSKPVILFPEPDRSLLTNPLTLFGVALNNPHSIILLEKKNEMTTTIVNFYFIFWLCNPPACDQCRKSKCKCERSGPGDSDPCKSCVMLGTREFFFIPPLYPRLLIFYPTFISSLHLIIFYLSENLKHAK